MSAITSSIVRPVVLFQLFIWKDGRVCVVGVVDAVIEQASVVDAAVDQALVVDAVVDRALVVDVVLLSDFLLLGCPGDGSTL